MNNDKLIDLEQEMLKTIDVLEKGKDYLADAISSFENLDETKKAVLAEEYNKLDKTLSAKDREMLALGSEVYKNHLAMLTSANAEKIRVKLKYDILMAKLDVLRSIYSGEKSRNYIQ
jgi:hypothetical protein